MRSVVSSLHRGVRRSGLSVRWIPGDRTTRDEAGRVSRELIAVTSKGEVCRLLEGKDPFSTVEIRIPVVSR